MKTAITSAGPDRLAGFDQRFGRAAWFCIYDENTGELEFHQNEHQGDGNGAGTKAAQTIIELGAQKVISGDFGPRAKELLERFNIQMVILQDEGLDLEMILKKLTKHQTDH